jgi:hypothetical protein
MVLELAAIATSKPHWVLVSPWFGSCFVISQDFFVPAEKLLFCPC